MAPGVSFRNFAHVQEESTMYSVVLLTAMLGGAEAPDHLGRHGGGGGCCGSSAGYSCGGGYGGCYGGGGGRLFGHRRGGGCYGGGGGCYGGYGGGYGGCYGGYGGGYGGCYGGYGGGYGGCYGGSPYAGCVGGTVVPYHPPEDVKKMPKPDDKKKKDDDKDDSVRTLPAMAPATIVVNLPADAKLTVDDNATSSTSERRLFVTPNLMTGREYHYTLKAEVIRDGKTVSVEEHVAVRPGEETRVTLKLPSAVASAR
jgi:uncharacterized protein (TIGR03000 family)